jgi:hypothetical protein
VVASAAVADSEEPPLEEADFGVVPSAEPDLGAGQSAAIGVASIAAEWLVLDTAAASIGAGESGPAIAAASIGLRPSAATAAVSTAAGSIAVLTSGAVIAADFTAAGWSVPAIDMELGGPDGDGARVGLSWPASAWLPWDITATRIIPAIMINAPFGTDMRGSTLVIIDRSPLRLNKKHTRHRQSAL